MQRPLSYDKDGRLLHPEHIVEDFYVGAARIMICDDCCVQDPGPILEAIARIGGRSPSGQKEEASA